LLATHDLGADAVDKDGHGQLERHGDARQFVDTLRRDLWVHWWISTVTNEDWVYPPESSVVWDILTLLMKRMEWMKRRGSRRGTLETATAKYSADATPHMASSRDSKNLVAR
jgi:hypothetical protein